MQSDIDIVRCCGRITSWEIFAKNAGTLKMIVWRPTEDVDYMKIVAMNTFQVFGQYI
jgi:hypothetical protein